MAKRELSREELFALVWERPSREIAKELGISDVAVGKLCEKLQVPKPPRGYWARVEAGQTPRRPALKAFREELEAKRRGALQARTAGHFTELQSKFLDAALEELRKRGVDYGTRPIVPAHLNGCVCACRGREGRSVCGVLSSFRVCGVRIEAAATLLAAGNDCRDVVGIPYNFKCIGNSCENHLRYTRWYE